MKFRILLVLAVFMAQSYTHAQEKEYLTQIGERVDLYSEVLGEDRTIYVEYPYGYQPGNGISYPVAYILDGEFLLPSLFNVQNYYSGGFTPDMILVGVANLPNRNRDLRDEPSTFLTFLKEELIPFVEERYPVTEYRTLIGHSYGGLFTISALLEEPNLFNNYLAIDPSLNWNDMAMVHRADEALKEKSFESTSLFVSLGGQLHMADASVTIENVMERTSFETSFARAILTFGEEVEKNPENGLNYSFKFYPRDLHGTIVYPSLMDGLIELFSWFQMEDTYTINAFDTPRDELYAIVKHREQKLKENFGYEEPPYSEELLNMSGYMNMDLDQPEKAKMYFEFAIEYYPNSPNVYDSMADFYLSQQNIDKAIEQIRKAIELSDDPYYVERLKELSE